MIKLTNSSIVWGKGWRGCGAPGRGGGGVVCASGRGQRGRLLCAGAVLSGHTRVTSSSQRLGLMDRSRREGGGEALGLARTVAPPAHVHPGAGAHPRQVVEAVALLLQARLPHNRGQTWNE